MYITICRIDGQCKFDAWSRAPKASALGLPRGIEEGGGGGGEGTHVCLWPIHIDVWQKPSQYCNYLPTKINKLIKKTNSGKTR